MRKLTIKRKWSIVECASKISLLVEIHEGEGNGKTNDGVGCKELPFKNGKSITLDITNDATQICVLSSTMRVVYTIPAGDSDVNLIAYPKYDPSQGNPFVIEEVK